MAVARLGLLGARRFEQDDVAIEQPGHPSHQSVAEPEQDQAEPRQPGERQDHPGDPQDLGHPAELGQPLQRAGAGRDRGRHPISARSSWWATKPNGSEASRSIARWRSKYEPVRGHAIRMATSKRNTEQIARSAQAKNWCWPAESGPALLQHPLGGDQPDQDEDQEQHRVLEHRHAAAAEQGLHPHRQQLLPPLGATRPARRSTRAPGGARPKGPRHQGRSSPGRRCRPALRGRPRRRSGDRGNPWHAVDGDRPGAIVGREGRRRGILGGRGDASGVGRPRAGRTCRGARGPRGRARAA